MMRQEEEKGTWNKRGTEWKMERERMRKKKEKRTSFSEEKEKWELGRREKGNKHGSALQSASFYSSKTLCFSSLVIKSDYISSLAITRLELLELSYLIPKRLRVRTSQFQNFQKVVCKWQPSVGHDRNVGLFERVKASLLRIIIEPTMTAELGECVRLNGKLNNINGEWDFLPFFLCSEGMLTMWGEWSPISRLSRRAMDQF